MSGRLDGDRKNNEAIDRKLKKEGFEYMLEYMMSFNSSMRGRESKTKQLYINYVYKFIDFAEKHYKIAGVNKEDKLTRDKLSLINYEVINDYLSSIETKVDKNGNASSTSGSYRATTWAALKCFCEWMVKEGIASTNACLMTERPSRKNDKPKKVVMTNDELRMVLNSVMEGTGETRASRIRRARFQNRDLLIILFFMETGIRITALTQINVEDIDMETGVLSIIDKNGTPFTCKLNKETLEIMKEWLEDREIILNGDKTDALFITSMKDRRIGSDAVTKLIKRYTACIDKNITPHKFRSTYATMIYEATGDIYKVQKCMGHKSTSTTERYIQDDGSYKDEAALIIGNNINLKQMLKPRLS